MKRTYSSRRRSSGKGERTVSGERERERERCSYVLRVARYVEKENRMGRTESGTFHPGSRYRSDPAYTGGSGPN